MEKLSNKIIVILGPTSSGKSDIAVKLAKKFDGEIISADSRQIYRGMDVGTGKIPKDKSKIKSQKSKLQVKNIKLIPYWSECIPHYLIDIVSPRTNYNAAKFKKDADKIIKDILNRGKLPIICGGTGFWIKALVDNVRYPEVKPDWELRNQLHNYSTEKLFTMLQKFDADRAKTIDAKNKVRLIRAIEICKKLDQVPGFIDSHSFVDSNWPYDFLQIGISIPKEKLHKNIKKRLTQRFKAGMIEEIKRLHFEDRISWKRLESFGLSYNLIPKYLKGEIATEDELFKKVFQAEKDYAKRQMTWFKKDKEILWFGKYKEIEKTIRSFIADPIHP
jgi:tRNA dimethylallyltransferase